MTHPHDNPARDALRALDQQRADTLADALRPDAAPPGDAAEVLRLREERNEISAECVRLRTRLAAALRQAHDLQEIIAGRTVPPTDAEMAQHDTAGGRWRWVSLKDDDALRGCSDDLSSFAIEAPMRGLPQRPGCAYVARWWALDATGRPCAWPVVDGGESREGEGR